MKFVCQKCQTKYTIPDERVHGKVLKVRCKTCGEIVEVREAPGGARAGSGPPPSPAPAPARPLAPTSARPAPAPAPTSGRPAPARPAPPSSAPQAPAAAGRYSMHAPKAMPQPSARPAPPPRPQGTARAGAPSSSAATAQVLATPAEGILDELRSVADQQAVGWFVAIQEVPVGPMKREEVKKKIQTGAVTGASLAWCEGMSDWIPLRQVAALAELLRVSAPAAAARPPPAPTPPPAPPPRRTEGASDLLAALREPRRSPSALRVDKTPAPASLPASPVPIPVIAAAVIAAPVVVPAPAPTQTGRTTSDSIVAALPIRRSRFGPLTIIALGFGVVFAFTLALGLLGFFGRRGSEQANARAPEPRAPEKVAAITGSANPGLRGLSGAPADEPPPAAADAGAASVVEAQKRRTGGTGPAKGTSAADEELLRRMGALAKDGTGDVRITQTSGRTKSGAGAAAAQGLTETQLRNVVNRERAGIQRCYERELRGTRNDEDIRLVLTVNIGQSGTVTGVQVGGAVSRSSPLGDCILSTVRRWRFPSASAPSTLESPFLLTAAR